MGMIIYGGQQYSSVQPAPCGECGVIVPPERKRVRQAGSMTTALMAIVLFLAPCAFAGAAEPPDSKAAEQYLAGDWHQRSMFWGKYQGAEIVAKGRVENVLVVNAGGVPKVLIVVLDSNTVGVMDIRYFIQTANFEFRDFLKAGDVFVFRGRCALSIR